MNVIKHLGRHLSQAKVITVKVPEALDGDGKPLVIRFRSRMTVADMIQLAELPKRTEDLVRLSLFRLMAIDGDGEPLVNPDDADWYLHGIDAKLICKIVDRAELPDYVFGEIEVPQDEGDGEGKQ